MKKILSLVTLFLFLTACSSYSNVHPFPAKDEKAEDLVETKSVDCSNAKKDVKVLEEEQKATYQKVIAGVRSVLPISVVVNLLAGNYVDNVEVATGTYNEDLKNKIEEIKSTCGV